MLVRDNMSKRIIGVAPRATLERAQTLMRQHEVRHLPVLRGSRLVGVLSDRDLRGVPPSKKCAQDVMTLNPISIAPDAAVDEAARLMHTQKISALPVVERGHVIGILTTSDVLRAFVNLSGAGELTTRIVVTATGHRGAEHEVRRIVQGCHGELKWMHRRGRQLHLRLKGRHIDDVVTALEGAGFNVVAVVSSQETGAQARGKASATKKVAR